MLFTDWLLQLLLADPFKDRVPLRATSLHLVPIQSQVGSRATVLASSLLFT